MDNLSTEQRAANIDSAWQAIRPKLANYDGAGVAQLMENLYEHEFPSWNACYWRTVKWLKDFLKARTPVAEGDFGEDHGHSLLVEFIRSCYPDRLDGNFGASELPFIMQRLKAKYGTPDKTAPDARRWPERDDLGSDVPF